MIRHVVLFSLTSPEHLETARAGLERLATNPHARALEVSVNLKSDPIGNGVDLIVHAVFDDEAALEAYRRHPVYQEAIDIVRPLRDVRVAADFVSTIT
ncbi:Dabb family protein [uncultured Rhodospira sp.]|uniref:Dabb family protein n=1 Tax=uncultured Rhodospira sp. TaxID=1936189 RepID=UPI0026219EA0|nr:Dabb family protein [uncultured Rhodospira sp.]